MYHAVSTVMFDVKRTVMRYPVKVAADLVKVTLDHGARWLAVSCTCDFRNNMHCVCLDHLNVHVYMIRALAPTVIIKTIFLTQKKKSRHIVSAGVYTWSYHRLRARVEATHKLHSSWYSSARKAKG